VRVALSFLSLVSALFAFSVLFLLYPEDIMEQEPIYQDVVGPDELLPWDGPLPYTSLQDPVQQQPKQQP
jgi:hypothetical protein